MVLVDLRDDQLWPGKVSYYAKTRLTVFRLSIAECSSRVGRLLAAITSSQCAYTRKVESRKSQSKCAPLRPLSRLSVIMVKSRMIPLELRPEPALLASTSTLTAYNHARHPSVFDKAAEEREKADAQERSHSGVHAPEEQNRIKSRKEAWNDQVNWIMNERRVEKMRNINEEREKRLQAVAKDPEIREKAVAEEEWGPSSSKRNCMDALQEDHGGIFAVPSTSTPPRSHTASPLFKPVLGSPQRPGSPRRLEKRRNGIYAGMGEYSPRGRRTTYTPPRILPSGDETAPNMQTSPSPVPSSLRFDFVSPLGPVHEGTLADGFRRSGSMSRISLEAVKEEPIEGEGEGEWTLVQKRGQRSGSAPCQKPQDGTNGQTAGAGMEVEVS